MALTVLLITVLPLSYVLTSAMSSAANARQRSAALQLADSWLEVLSNSTLPTTGGVIITNVPQNPATFPGLSAATTQIPKSTLAGTPFVVHGELHHPVGQQPGPVGPLLERPAPEPLPSGGDPAPDHGDLEPGRTTRVNETTAVNYPKPGLQTEGFLAVQLTNSGEPRCLHAPTWPPTA